MATFNIVIRSSIFYKKTIEAETAQEAQERADEALYSGQFTDWKQVDADSEIFDLYKE